MSAIPTKSRLLVKAREDDRCLRCGGPGRQWHHRRKRRVLDEHQHCACNGAWMCLTCHSWAHGNPVAARDAGYILASTVPVPGEWPVASRHGNIRLDCEGKFAAVPQ